MGGALMPEDIEVAEGRMQWLGRPAMFLIPHAKLETWLPEKNCVAREWLDRFLTRNFGPYTTEAEPRTVGIWLDKKGAIIIDKCIPYRVCFVGKERVPELGNMLCRLAYDVGEECIYVETGEDGWLAWPKKEQ